MSSPTVVNTKNNIEVSRRVSFVLADAEGKPSVVLADASGNVPDRFELLKVGMWRTPYHGDIMIMPTDLDEYIENYQAGHGVSGNGKLKLPINYEHQSWGKAAGWFVPAKEGDTLWATEVEWTPAAKQALKDGEYKCISAEFNPAGRGGWCDPLDEEHYVENVLEGAALTNIPLFSNLEPVMASAGFGKDSAKPNVFLITASEVKEKSMTLAEVLAKENDALTDEERTLLVENKDTLTAEDRTKFGFEVQVVKKEEESEVPEPIVEKVEDKELSAVAASIKSGEKTLVDSKVWADTQKQVTDLRRTQVKASVETHLARGAIKADQVDLWTDKILADSSMQKMLEDLPTNPVMASAQGSDADAGDATALEAELHEKVAAAKRDEANKGKSYSEVRASIIKSDEKFKSLANTQSE